jgi:sigma-B regulation protein RsbU (phosphoserine phosphatase)
MQKLFKFQFKSITHRLIFSCVVSAIAIYSISYWHGRYLIQKNLRSFIIDLSQSRIDSAAHQIEENLIRVERDLSPLHQNIQNVQNIQDSTQNTNPLQTDLLPQLKNFFEQQPHLEAIALVNLPNGKSDSSNRSWQYDRQGEFKNIISNEAQVWLNRCQSDRAGLINQTPNQGFWTEPYFLNNSEKSRITYCVPLTNKSKVTASSAIAIEINLDWLADFMKQKLANTDEIRYLELGDIFVAIPSNKPDRQWLIKPNSQQQIQSWLSQQKLFPQNKNTDKNLDNTSLIRQPINSQATSLTDSQGSLITQTVNSTGWIVGIGFPVSKFEQASRQYLWLMIISMSRDIGLVCVVIAVILQVTTRSLRDLNISTEEMAKGNLDTILPSVKSEDEVGRLTRSFQLMQNSLQLYIHNLQETTAAKQKLESELSIAAQIQRTMLPKINVGADSLYQISALLKPARIVGGDFYDFFVMGNDRLCLIIGDVADKGFPSALQMARTITLIRTLTKASSTPSEILTSVNQELCAENDECQFVTVFCGVLELDSGRFTYASGGHDAPILVRDRQVQVMKLETSPPLGLYEEAIFEQNECNLFANDLILFYTDGITEAMNSVGEFFSDTKLIEMLTSYPPTSPTKGVRTIQHFCQQFVGDAPQSDDMTLLAMQYLPSSPYLQSPNIMEWNLTLNSELTELENVKQSLNKILNEAGLTGMVIEDAQLIAEEILTNIIEYGYENRNDGHIDLRLEINERNLIMTFKDGGKPFNPLIEVVSPDLNLDDGERSQGGFGFFLVQELSERVDYTYRDGKNILTVSQAIFS